VTDTHVHVHCGLSSRKQARQLGRVLALLDSHTARLEALMAVAQNVRDVLTRIDAATTQIATRIRDLLAEQGLNTDEKAAFEPLLKQLEDMGKNPEQPVPEPVPPVEPTEPTT
jgi:hypothetical protein